MDSTLRGKAAKASQMSKMVETARRLRTIRAASRQFLALWALQQSTERLKTICQEPGNDALADFANHDWSLLYRGSVLDD
ncbi:MAG TPA: hypothetical protein VNL70_10405 [Tepidisphaeraceae bacterium]|nr:hypothetical protein [Tepidisphaeraceae bacterium]